MEGDARDAASGGASRRHALLERAVIAHARAHPEDGQARVAQALCGSGQRISPAGVRYIWRKHGLETTYKRLRALGAGGDRALTPGQLATLRRGEAAHRLVQRSRRNSGGGLSRRDERRGRILLAAAELFDRRGYAGASIRNIAEWAGLLPGSVYHYYPTKEELFVAVNHEAFRRLERRIRTAVAGVSTARRKLEAACAAHVEAVVAGDPIARFGATALFDIHERQLQQRMQADRESYDALFRELIAGLKLPRGTDRTVYRLSLVGALNWTRLWYRRGRLSPGEIAARIVAAFCAGPRAPPSRARRPG